MSVFWTHSVVIRVVACVCVWTWIGLLCRVYFCSYADEFWSKDTASAYLYWGYLAYCLFLYSRQQCPKIKKRVHAWAKVYDNPSFLSTLAEKNKIDIWVILITAFRPVVTIVDRRRLSPFKCLLPPQSERFGYEPTFSNGWELELCIVKIYWYCRSSSHVTEKKLLIIYVICRKQYSIGYYFVLEKD